MYIYIVSLTYVQLLAVSLLFEYLSLSFSLNVSIHIHSTHTYKDDTIGMAVDLWSEVTVERADKFEITAEGDGAEDLPRDESNFLCVGVKAAFETAQKPVPELKYHVKSRIPYARGLGSSSAAIVAGIIAGLVLAGHRLPCWGSEALLQIAAGIEVSRSSRLIDIVIFVVFVILLFVFLFGKTQYSLFSFLLVCTLGLSSSPCFVFFFSPSAILLYTFFIHSIYRATRTMSLPPFMVVFK